MRRALFKVIRRDFVTAVMSTKYSAQVTARLDLHDSDAKWVGLKALKWTDPSGKKRTWECADRKTRNGEVDGEIGSEERRSHSS